MTTAKDQAIAQVATIIKMVEALQCDYDRLRELRDICSSNDTTPEDLAELEELERLVGDCNSMDDAIERITESPLSVEVRSGWQLAASDRGALSPAEFRIILCNGPRVELVGTLSEYMEPCSIRVMYQGSWSGESGELFEFDRASVLAFCEQFYFGE